MNDSDLPEEGSVFEQHAPADLPAVEGPALLITYEGDITEKLRASGTQAPFRLNADGDTEQMISAFKGKAASNISDEEWRTTGARIILEDAAKNGRIKSHRWLDLPKPKTEWADNPMAALDREIDWRLLAGMRGPTVWDKDPDEVRKIARLVQRRLYRNPLIIDVIRRMNSHIPNTRAEHAIGHKLWAQAICAETILKEDEPEPWAAGESMMPNLSAVVPLALLRAADVYLWSEKTERLARSSPLPKHVISKTVFHGTMFWAREFPHGGDDWINNWFVLSALEDGLLCAHDAVRHTGDEFRVMQFDIEFGKTWPTDFSPDDVNVVGEILKRCAFLNSPFVTTEKHKVARHIRRQMERQNQEPPEDDVSVVVLRRALVRKPQQPSGEHPGVEWKHHWWVGDHYRAQWYPSEQAHRVIWIAPFIKGDLSKPLLEKVYNVKR